jgi:hypothetical protein
LYPGKSNNEMLRMQMDSMGPFPRKMLRKSKFWQRHFNVQNFHFLQICIDEVSQQVRSLFVGARPLLARTRSCRNIDHTTTTGVRQGGECDETGT